MAPRDIRPKPIYKWSTEETNHFMLWWFEEYKNKRCGPGAMPNDEAQKIIVQKFKAKFGKDIPFHPTMKYKIDSLKRDFREWKLCANRSGVSSVDWETGMIEASDEWWQATLKTCPQFRRFWCQPFKYTKYMAEMIGRSCKTGHHERVDHNQHMQDHASPNTSPLQELRQVLHDSRQELKQEDNQPQQQQHNQPQQEEEHGQPQEQRQECGQPQQRQQECGQPQQQQRESGQPQQQHGQLQLQHGQPQQQQHSQPQQQQAHSALMGYSEAIIALREAFPEGGSDFFWGITWLRDPMLSWAFVHALKTPEERAAYIRQMHAERQAGHI